jgi:hypothetical protein
MTTLAARDKLINHLQEQIQFHKNLLGNKLSDEEAAKLRNLKDYLEKIGRGGEKDLATINALLMHN